MPPTPDLDALEQDCRLLRDHGCDPCGFAPRGIALIAYTRALEPRPGRRPAATAENGDSMHYTLSVTCDNCGAVIRFEDERPPWRWERPTQRLNATAPYRYVSCPACDGRAYLGSGDAVEPTADTADAERPALAAQDA